MQPAISSFFLAAVCPTVCTMVHELIAGNQEPLAGPLLAAVTEGLKALLVAAYWAAAAGAGGRKRSVWIGDGCCLLTAVVGGYGNCQHIQYVQRALQAMQCSWRCWAPWCFRCRSFF